MTSCLLKSRGVSEGSLWWMKFKILAHLASMHTKFHIGAYLGRFPEWWKQKISAAEVERVVHTGAIYQKEAMKEKKKKQGKLSILITWSTIRSTSQRSEAKFTPLPEAINSYLCSKTQCGHNKFLPWLQSIQLFRGIFNDYKMANKKSIGEKKKKEIHCNHIACGQILQNQFSSLNFFYCHIYIYIYIYIYICNQYGIPPPFRKHCLDDNFHIFQPWI